MVTEFSISVEYDDDNLKDVEVLDSILSNIDLSTYNEIGVKLKVDKDLKERYSNYIKTNK